jgi:hypothetical protein
VDLPQAIIGVGVAHLDITAAFKPMGDRPSVLAVVDPALDLARRHVGDAQERRRVWIA